MQVAIDGPAGSGKSTVCKILAQRYGLIYLDTGAMYRAVAWCCINFDKDEVYKDLSKIGFEFSDGGKSLAISFKDSLHDVTCAIRTPDVSAKVSEVSKKAEVRNVLTKKQQEYAKGNDVIMEGRDITTVVLPNADIKVFLTATAQERARRRFIEWGDKPDLPSFEEVLAGIIKRDEIDSSRDIAPLKQARDAVLIDTTGLTLEEVAEKIGELIEAKRK